MSTRQKQIRELKAQLKELRADCKKCDRWECGYCAESKYRVEEKIYELEHGGTI